MSNERAFYGTAYGRLWDDLHAQIRRETYGEDIGQNSWLTSTELGDFARRLGISTGERLLDVGSGSGGPSLYLAREFGLQVIGLDLSEEGVGAANKLAQAAGLEDRVVFHVADMRRRLTLESEIVDAVLCIDSINHLGERLPVLQEWRRILRPGGRVLFTDPVVLTGLVTREELNERSMSGPFVFVPPGANERFIQEAGLQFIEALDTTVETASVAQRWCAARRHRETELAEIEGADFSVARTHYFELAQRLYAERRLSRIAYLGQRLR